MADTESQKTPLDPATVKSHTLLPTTARKHRKASKSPVYILAIILIISTVILITFSVILRVNNPKLKLNIISFQSFVYVNMTSLNVTMLTELTINNRNFGSYDYDKCTPVVLYKRRAIGSGDVASGSVESRSRKSISIVMNFGTNMLNMSDDSKDLMEIISFVKMSGRVRVMKVVDRRRTFEMNCTVRIDLKNELVTSLLC